MTAWQDQPPISRRQVRQNERDDKVVASAADAQKLAAQKLADVLNVSGSSPAAAQGGENPSGIDGGFEGFGRQSWDDAVRRTTFESTPITVDHSARSAGAGAEVAGRLEFLGRADAAQGRRAHTGPVDAQGLAEARKASQTPVAGYDGFSFRNRVGEPDVENDNDIADSALLAEPTRHDYKMRDFSPEARRTSFAAAPQDSASEKPDEEKPAAVGERLEYQTLAADRLAADRQAAEWRATAEKLAAEKLVAEKLADGRNTSDATAQAASAVIPSQPRTRREMRALEQAGILAPLEVARESAREDIPRLRARIRNTGTDTDQIRTHDLANAIAEYDVISAQTAAVRAAIDAEAITSANDGELAPTSAATVFPLIEPGPFGFSLSGTDTSPLPASAVPASAALADAAPAAPQPQAVENVVERSDVAVDESHAAEAYVPPVGHWSTQALIDDDEQFQENTLSRNIASTSGAITASSIVIPMIPSVDDILSPLGSTGEILITGTINLPSSMGHTGAVPALYDHSDVDALLAEDDREDYPNTDSAPVRAIRAVSTNTSSGAVITTGMPKGNTKLPMILTIAAAGMATLIVVLTVVAFATGLF